MGYRGHRRCGSSALAASLAAMAVAASLPAQGIAASSSPRVAHVAGNRVTDGQARSLGQLPAALTARGMAFVVTDSANNLIRLVDPSSGRESVLYGDGQQTVNGRPPSAGVDGRKVSFAGGLVAGAPNGTTYVWDALQAKIVAIDSQGSLAVRDMPAGTCSIGCSAMAVSNGDLFLTGGRTDPRVYRVTSDNSVTVVAGTGQPGHTGDGGPATAAKLNDPVDLAIDAVGEVFVADASGAYIRKIANGMITAVAGTGTLGDTGDGGPATAADIQAVHIDSTPLGTLFFTGGFDAVVRRVASNGTITRYAGIPNGGAGMPQPFPSRWDDGKAALDAAFLRLGDLAVTTDGTVFVAQLSNDSGIVRSIAPTGNHTVQTVAGNGTSGYGSRLVSPPQAFPFPYPQLAMDRKGRILVAGTSDRVVRRVNPVTGSMEVVIGSGACCAWTSADPHGAVVGVPDGIAVAGDGTIYVADADPDDRLAAVSPKGRFSVVVDVVGFTHPPGRVIEAEIHPGQLAVDAAGRLYLANRCAIDVISRGRLRTVAGTPGQCDFSGWGGRARDAHIGFVYGLTVDPHGRVLFTSLGGAPSGRVGRIGANGHLSQLCDCFGASIAVDSQGTVLLDGIQRVDRAQQTSRRLSQVPPNKPFPYADSGDGGALAESVWYAASASVIAPDGTVYVDDGGVIRSIMGLAGKAVHSSAPRAVTATLSSTGNLHMRWSPPRFTGGDLPRGYRVLVMPGKHRVSVDGGAFKAVLRGLQPHATYTVYVRAKNWAGLSKPASARAG